mgnify:CR=1 FL=1
MPFAFPGEVIVGRHGRRVVSGLAIIVATGEPRLSEISLAYGGRSIPPPQTYYDRRALKSQDVDYALPAFTHVAIKNGNWSDSTTWDVGTVPGNNAVVRTGAFNIVYDVSSNAQIWAVQVDPLGTFAHSTTIETKLVVYCFRNRGVHFWQDTQPSATTGKARHEILFWFPESPGATAKGGYVSTGPIRWAGQKKSRRLTCADITAGATTITLDRVPENWRVGDSLLIGALSTPARAASDPQYTGPTSAYLPINNSFGVRTNSYGYAQSHDEVRTIAAISGTSITLNAAVTYDHLSYTETVPLPPTGFADGVPASTTITLKPFVVMLSSNLMMRTLGGETGDTAIWSGADLTNTQKRAHVLFSEVEGGDVRYVELRDMGRTDLNPTLTGPDGFQVRATSGGTILSVSTNVNERYAFQVRGNPPHFSGQPFIAEGVSVWAKTAQVPCPGKGIVMNDARVHIEDCVVYNVRGSCYATETGDEIGQVIRSTASWARGDGFARDWGDRHELVQGHNGHSGNGFDMQARQVLLHGNIVTSCSHAYPYHQQTTGADSGTGGFLPQAFLEKMPRDVDLRFFDPITQGGDGGIWVNALDYYGPRQPQIPDFVGNRAYGCAVGMYVAHRGPDRQDSTPMIARGFHCLKVRNPVHLANYTNTYYYYDSLWVGQSTASGNVGAFFGNVMWRMMLVNMKLKDFNVGVQDAGLLTNYDGFFIHVDTVNVTTPFQNDYQNLNQAAATHPANGVMGPWTIDGSNPNRAIVRTWASITDADLPQPYPLAPFGLHLDGGYPAVGVGDTPYFVLDASSDTTMAMGNTRNQITIIGVIRDSVGDRRLGDWQSNENGLDNMSVKGPRRSYNMTAEQCIVRNGCWNDAGTWKSRCWFTDADRRTGAYFHYYIDMTITGVTAGHAAFMAANTVDPNVPPPFPTFPEVIQPARPYVADTTAPTITSPTTASVRENSKLALPLKCNEVRPTWTITGGADAARFEIALVNAQPTLRWLGDGTQDFEAPADAGANNVYDVTISVADPRGNTSSAPHVITVTDEFDAVVSPFTDNFNRADQFLDASNFYSFSGGDPNGLGVASSVLRSYGTSAAFRSGYFCPRPGSNNHYIQAKKKTGYGGTFLCVSMTDHQNWIGVLSNNDSSLRLTKCIGGVQTLIQGIDVTFTTDHVLRIEHSVDGGGVRTITVINNGVSVYSATPSGPLPPVSNRVGLLATDNARTSEYDDLQCGALEP